MNSNSAIDQAVIAAISLDPHGAGEKTLGLTPEMFESPSHQLFYRRWVETGDVFLALIDAGLYTANLATWRSAINNDPDCLSTMVNQLIERSRKIALGKAISAAHEAFKAGDPDEARRLSRLAAEMNLSRDTGKLLDAVELAEQFVIGLDATRGAIIKTHIRPIDQALGGLIRGNLSIIGGRPGMGKSAFLGQIGYNVALSGKKVVFLEWDMSAWKVFGRYVLGQNGDGLKFRDVVEETYPKRDLELIKGKARDLGNSLKRHFLATSERLTDSDLLVIALREQPDLIIVDLVSQFALARERNEPDYAWHGRKAEALAYIARRTNCHIMGAVQIGRQVETRLDKRPSLSDLRDSGKYEEVADNVCLLYRDTYYEKLGSNETAPKQSNLELNVLKNRDGEQNLCIDVLFNLARQQICAYQSKAEKKAQLDEEAARSALCE